MVGVPTPDSPYPHSNSSLSIRKSENESPVATEQIHYSLLVTCLNCFELRRQDHHVVTCAGGAGAETIS